MDAVFPQSYILGSDVDGHPHPSEKFAKDHRVLIDEVLFNAVQILVQEGQLLVVLELFCVGAEWIVLYHSVEELVTK